MRKFLSTTIAMFSLVAVAAAQNADHNPRPLVNGNRANGLNYQPTPQQVAPREKAAGIQPPAAGQQAANRDLERMDKDLMRKEGLGTDNVPKMTKDQGTKQ